MQTARATATKKFKNSGFFCIPPSWKFMVVITTANVKSDTIKTVLVNKITIPSFSNYQWGSLPIRWLNSRKMYIPDQFVKPDQNRKLQGIQPLSN